MALSRLSVILAAPRGFCAGVDRAVAIVEHLLSRFGAPIYVRHEIVHNRFVVEGLKARGAVFVEELDAVPRGSRVVLSAHGVPTWVMDKAAALGLIVTDATCPLVAKVHAEARRHARQGCDIVLIGHAGHPEVIGTTGQVSGTRVHLVETPADAEALCPADPGRLALVTQTTLAVDETADIVARLRARFPAIRLPPRGDICFATTARQAAVKAIAGRCDAILVIGAPNSSNSRRLTEVAARAGCAKVRLIETAADLDWDWLSGVATLGISAGASAPEVLAEGVLAALGERRALAVEESIDSVEEAVFPLPPDLRDP